MYSLSALLFALRSVVAFGESAGRSLAGDLERVLAPAGVGWAVLGLGFVVAAVLRRRRRARAVAPMAAYVI